MEQPLLLSDVCIVLLGKTGAGKSASGNTIMGGDRNTFIEGFLTDFRTTICKEAQTEVDGLKIKVIDTIEITEASVKDTGTQNKIEQIFSCAKDGVDVFLLVIKLGDKLTDGEQKKLKLMWIQETFGAKALKHTLVLFSHGDHLHVPVEKCLREYKTLRSTVDQCSGGYHVFNNKDENRSQVTELLKKIKPLCMMNGEKYTKQDYEKHQNECLDEQCRREAERQKNILKKAAESAKEKERLLLETAVVGGGLGAAVGGGVGLAIAAQMGADVINEIKTIAGGSCVAAAAAAVLGAGVYYFANKDRKTE